MKILEVKTVVFPEVKASRYARFHDERGFFAETYKKSDLKNNPDLAFLNDADMVQSNVSFSKRGVIRGLHFQWDPLMGKLIRTIQGRMIDLFLDIRIGSPTFGKIGAFEMAAAPENEDNWLIWIPAGFAHGSIFTEETYIEYFCTSEYSPQTEAGISPLASDIDWSLCDKTLKAEFNAITAAGPIMSEKDKQGYSLTSWQAQPEAKNFSYTS